MLRSIGGIDAHLVRSGFAPPDERWGPSDVVVSRGPPPSELSGRRWGVSVRTASAGPDLARANRRDMLQADAQTAFLPRQRGYAPQPPLRAGVNRGALQMARRHA